MGQLRTFSTHSGTVPMSGSCREPTSLRLDIARGTLLFALFIVAPVPAEAQTRDTLLATQRVLPHDDSARFLDPRPFANDNLEDARRRTRRMVVRADRAAAPASIPRAQAPPTNPASTVVKRNDPNQTVQQSAVAATPAQDQVSQPAQEVQHPDLFDPRRLTASVLLDVTPNARTYTGNFSLTYAATDNYQIGLLLPLAYQGGFGTALMANNVTVRNTFLRTFTDRASFFGATVDTAFGDNVVFRRPNTFLTVSPFLGLRLPDRYDLFLSGSWGASIAATGKLTRALTDEWNVGVEYSRAAGAAGQLLPARNQQQTILGVAELNRDGRQISFGLGASVANGVAGLAARFGVTQSFR